MTTPEKVVPIQNEPKDSTLSITEKLHNLDLCIKQLGQEIARNKISEELHFNNSNYPDFEDNKGQMFEHKNDSETTTSKCPNITSKNSVDDQNVCHLTLLTMNHVNDFKNTLNKTRSCKMHLQTFS